jgi:hypothetical protein
MKGWPEVVAMVDNCAFETVRLVRIRGTGVDLHYRSGPGAESVLADGGKELGGFIAGVVSAIIPGHRDPPAPRVDRQPGEELAAGRIGVHLHRFTPIGPGVSGVSDPNIRVRFVQIGGGRIRAAVFVGVV